LPAIRAGLRMKPMKILVPALLVWLLATAAHAATTWDGVFSDAQAARGLEQYLQHCSVCHAASLEGNYASPPLVGRFMPDWAGSPLSDLYDYISSTMPLDRPGSLSAAAYADIVAYLLKANGFPSGPSELQPGPGLAAIPFDIAPPQSGRVR
ncbi:MAG: c-type cytochrome, partial [Rhizomicrobium sp.]